MVHVPPTTPVPSMVFATPVDPPPPPPPPTESNPALARFSLAGKHAVITGAAGHLALSAAHALLEHGLRALTLLDMAVDPLIAAKSTLSAAFPGVSIIVHPLDVTDSEEVIEVIKAVVRTAGHIDVLLCYAGIVHAKHALQHTATDFRRVVDVNTIGGFLLAQAVVQAHVDGFDGGLGMGKGAGKGEVGQGVSVVFIASISGHTVNFPQPQVAYNASKTAIVSMARNLGAEWAVHGVRVNSVSPGYMDTILNEGSGLDEHRRIWKERTPMGRLGRKDELNGVIVMLSSEAGSYITGTDIKVDGGITTM